MSSAKLANRLCLLVDRMMTQLERTMLIHEGEPAKSSGLGYLPQQVVQMSQAISYMRKEERETAKNPLEADKEVEKAEEEILQEIMGALSVEDLEMLLQMKKEELDESKGSEEIHRQGRE